jgi:U3 small nucleolar RNA-associated protein 4
VGRDGKVTPGKLRLFSIGFSTAITEWDLAAGKPLRHSDGNHGEIWCIAAQPRRIQPAETAATGQREEAQNQYLVTGCGDGTLVLHSTADGDLQYLRRLAKPSRKSKVLCLAFQCGRNVAAGYADSAIRIYSVGSGEQIARMSLGSGPKGGPAAILVWAIHCLPDGTVVTGDSTGEIKFWDFRTCTLSQRIKSHRADILTLTANAEGTKIMTGGMDRRTTVYSIGAKSGRWAEVAHQRYHSHDVKAMATYETKELSIVASGGKSDELCRSSLKLSI